MPGVPCRVDRRGVTSYQVSPAQRPPSRARVVAWARRQGLMGKERGGKAREGEGGVRVEDGDDGDKDGEGSRAVEEGGTDGEAVRGAEVQETPEVVGAGRQASVQSTAILAGLVDGDQEGKDEGEGGGGEGEGGSHSDDEQQALDADEEEMRWPSSPKFDEARMSAVPRRVWSPGTGIK